MQHHTVELEDEVKRKLNELLPWGVQSKFFRIIINDIIIALSGSEELREKIIGGVLSGRIKASDISSILKEGD